MNKLKAIINEQFKVVHYAKGKGSPETKTFDDLAESTSQNYAITLAYRLQREKGVRFKLPSQRYGTIIAYRQ